VSARLLENVFLSAGSGLRFIDPYSAQPIVDGLRCTLLRRRDRRVIGVGIASPSGVHHWPAIAPPWSDLATSPPQPPEDSLAEVLVEDRFERFLPVRLPWPPTPDAPGSALNTTLLASAPTRSAPSGAATVHALLATEAGQAVAWARVVATDAQARSTTGMSDADGRLTLHLPFPRPERKTPQSPPEPVVSVCTTITLRVFHDPAVGSEALAGSAPWLAAWHVQPEVRALARLGTADPFGSLRLEPGRPGVPITEGLPPNRSELRLAPF